MDPNMGAPLTGCTTIDATTPNGYLDKARTGNPGAAGNLTTEQAAENLRLCEMSYPSKQPANIVGHGAEGDIDTGQALGQCMTVDNIDEWRPLLEPLRDKISELYLFGCSVGGGEDGAELLYEIAQTINAPVSAPTGLIYCHADGHFSLEPNAVWQTATPAARPPTIQPPNQGANGVNGSSAGARGSTEVVDARYTPKGDDLALTGENAKSLAREVLWDNPVKLPGEPGAKVTGHLVVTLKLKDGKQTRSLLVLGHTLLKDVKTAQYYRATSSFKALLKRK